MNEYQLTDKALFIESNEQAIKHLTIIVGNIHVFLDPLVQASNADSPEALELWRITDAMIKSLEVYSEQF